MDWRAGFGAAAFEDTPRWEDKINVQNISPLFGNLHRTLAKLGHSRDGLQIEFHPLDLCRDALVRPADQFYRGDLSTHRSDRIVDQMGSGLARRCEPSGSATFLRLCLHKCDSIV